MPINLTNIFLNARTLDREDYYQKEELKKGNLRAGSSGIMSEQGEVAGQCHRKSHLRSLGLEIERPEAEKLLMFDLGYASEDIVYKKLISGLPAGHTILREEEIPIEWTTSNGTKVTGRPDIVICTEEEIVVQPTDETRTLAYIDYKKKPVLGMELKSVHSMWVAREVLFAQTPKTSNLIQAAHYMWKLGVPYKLVYTNYSQLGQGMAGNDWIIKQFPRPGEPGSEFIEYNPKGQIKHIKQFQIVYDMRIDENGRVHYKLENADKWNPTIITIPDIERYFEFTSNISTTQNLGPLPTAIDPHGGKLSYKDCSYCPLQETCDKGLSYEKWLAEVKEISAKVISDNTDKV